MVRNIYYLDSSTRTSPTRTRFNLFFRVFEKILIPRKASLYFFPPEKLALLFLLKEVKPSPDPKMIKLLTFDNLFLLLRHSR